MSTIHKLGFGGCLLISPSITVKETLNSAALFRHFRAIRIGEIYPALYSQSLVPAGLKFGQEQGSFTPWECAASQRTQGAPLVL